MNPHMFCCEKECKNDNPCMNVLFSQMTNDVSVHVGVVHLEGKFPWLAGFIPSIVYASHRYGMLSGVIVFSQDYREDRSWY